MSVTNCHSTVDFSSVCTFKRSFSNVDFSAFYPRDAMHSAISATATCLSVRLSVRHKLDWGGTVRP